MAEIQQWLYVEDGGMRKKKRRKNDLAVATQGFSKLFIIIILPHKEWLIWCVL